MDWKRAIEEERAMLMRLVALLHALARLAEIAAGRAPAVRGLVLWLLRRAEAVMRDFVGVEPAPGAHSIAPDGNRPEDAMRLAATLRALAWQLQAEIEMLLSLPEAYAGSTGPDHCVDRRASARRSALDALAFLARCNPHPVPAPDTS